MQKVQKLSDDGLVSLRKTPDGFDDSSYANRLIRSLTTSVTVGFLERRAIIRTITLERDGW